MNAFPSFVDGRVIIKLGDITREAVDAVVNAANGSLLGGGGVDGAIHRAGGPAILEACKAIRATRYPEDLPAGEAVITTAGRMAARHVIHTAGPVYGGGSRGEAGKLADCYRNALDIASDQGLCTVAFPAISTGVYGYPADEAAAVASQAIEGALNSHPSIREVRLVFSHGTNASGERQRPGAIAPWAASGAGPQAKPKAPAVGHFQAGDAETFLSHQLFHGKDALTD